LIPLEKPVEALPAHSWRGLGTLDIHFQTIAPLRGAFQEGNSDWGWYERGRFVRLGLGEDARKFPFLRLAGFHEKGVTARFVQKCTLRQAGSVVGDDP